MTETSRKAPGAESKPLLSQAEIDDFAARSPALGAILQADDAKRIDAAYVRDNERAMAVQNRFFHVARHLNWSVFATAIIGALILTVGVIQPSLKTIVERWPDLIPWILGLLGFLGLLVGGYASARLYELNAGDLARRWMQSRARAEQLRSEYFERLVARAATADPATQIAALELVAKHLLGGQLTYFAERGKRHEAAAGRWLQVAAFATGAASVGVAAGGMAGAAGNPWILAIASLGAIGVALTTFATSQETIGQERERAERFRTNADALELLARKIDDVRNAVAAGASEPLVTFTAAINQQLTLELGRFLEGGDGIRASISALSQQIEKSRAGQQNTGGQAQGGGG